jgi:hypothetical protein
MNSDEVAATGENMMPDHVLMVALGERSFLVQGIVEMITESYGI